MKRMFWVVGSLFVLLLVSDSALSLGRLPNMQDVRNEVSFEMEEVPSYVEDEVQRQIDDKINILNEEFVLLKNDLENMFDEKMILLNSEVCSLVDDRIDRVEKRDLSMKLRRSDSGLFIKDSYKNFERVIFNDYDLDSKHTVRFFPGMIQNYVEDGKIYFYATKQTERIVKKELGDLPRQRRILNWIKNVSGHKEEQIKVVYSLENGERLETDDETGTVECLPDFFFKMFDIKKDSEEVDEK